MSQQEQNFREALSELFKHELSRIEDCIMESDATKDELLDVERLINKIEEAIKI